MEAMSIIQAAERLRMDRKSVVRLCREGRLSVIKHEYIMSNTPGLTGFEDGVYLPEEIDFLVNSGRQFRIDIRSVQRLRADLYGLDLWEEEGELL